MGALQEKDDVGVISHELFDPRIVSPAEDVRELFMGLLNDRHRIFHGARTLELKRWALLGHDLGAVRYRMARIERVRDAVGPAGIPSPAPGRVNRRRKRYDETKNPVLADHLGQKHTRVLTDSIGDQVIVESFLGVRTTTPSATPYRAYERRVGIARTRNRRADRACGRDHHLHRHYGCPKSASKSLPVLRTPTPETAGENARAA